MTLDEMAMLDDEHVDEFLKFERVEPKRSARRDLHAFLLLDELVPGARPIVSAAEHDEVFLGVNPNDLATVVTPDQFIELVRCGVRYDTDRDSLMMFA